MSKKASLDSLYDLHNLITEYYKKAIDDAIDEEIELSSGTLAAINAHLKTNGITVDLVEESPIEDMTTKLRKLMKNKESA